MDGNAQVYIVNAYEARCGEQGVLQTRYNGNQWDPTAGISPPASVSLPKVPLHHLKNG